MASSLYAQDYKDSECYQKYKTKNQNKLDKRERQLHTMLYGINLQTSSGDILNFRPVNYSPDEINFFEREVIAASDFDLESYMGTLKKAFGPPAFLALSYDKAREKIPTATYYEVQKALRAGFVDGDYCKWYGIMRPNQVAKMVAKKISESRKEESHLRAPAVVDIERSEVKEISPEENFKLIDGGNKVKGE